MIKVLRDFRLLPLVLLATVSLLALKSLGLLFDGGYLLGPSARQHSHAVQAPAHPALDGTGDIVGSVTPAKSEPTTPEVTAPLVLEAPPDPEPASRPSWAQEMFNFPEITGSIGGGDKEAMPAKKEEPAKRQDEDAVSTSVQTDAQRAPDRPAAAPERRVVSSSERAILARLQERRKELDARARAVDMRESLIKAAEKRLESRVGQLKQMQGRIEGAQEKKDDVAEERVKDLVAMYENMKAKDAARIFDRLSLDILVNLAGQIKPRRMADILANMSPEAAERLTVELANGGSGRKPRNTAELPKIEGRPNPTP